MLQPGEADGGDSWLSQLSGSGGALAHRAISRWCRPCLSALQQQFPGATNGVVLACHCLLKNDVQINILNLPNC